MNGIRRWLRDTFDITAVSLVIGIVAVSVVLGLLSPYFWTIPNFAVLLKIMPTLVFLSLGVNFLLISGEIDISFVAVLNLTAMTIALLSAHMHWLLATLIGVICAGAVGVMNGYLSVIIGIPSFLTTLATAGGVQGLVLLISGYRSVSVRTDAIEQIFRFKLPHNFDVSLFWAVGGVLLSIFILHKTRFGRNMYAIGGNERSARRMGIPVRKIKFRLFVVSALMAAMASLIAMARVGSVRPGLGDGNMMPAIAAAILGGAALTGGEGSTIKTVLGVLLLRLIVNGFNLLGMEPATQDLAMGGVLIATLAVRLMSSRRTAEG